MRPHWPPYKIFICTALIQLLYIVYSLFLGFLLLSSISYSQLQLTCRFTEGEPERDTGRRTE